MIKRFQIEDLVAQDAFGVVFRALDAVTGRIVAVRRFFPFGADGGGLHADEQPAYCRAVSRLTDLSHPALRAVIGGGCDPVDGIPFLATEWIEGAPLRAVLALGPLPAGAAADLLARALDVCELLSYLMGEEAVWVETSPQSIIVGSARNDREFTFWISPLTWLGKNDPSRGLAPIVTLTEELMGWHDRPVHDEAGDGLGAWFNWLRDAPATTRLHEAREMLAAAVGAAPPRSARHLVAEAMRRHAKTRLPAVAKRLRAISLGLGCVAAGLGTWLLGRQGASNAIPQHDGVIHWTHREVLANYANKEVVVEGVLEKIAVSDRQKTMYLLFSKVPEKNDARGAMAGKADTAHLSESALAPLIGKKVRLHGTVRVQKGLGLERPEIVLKDRAAVEVVE